MPLLADAVVAVEDGRHQRRCNLVAARASRKLRPGLIGVGVASRSASRARMLDYWRGRADSASATCRGGACISSSIVDRRVMRLFTPIEYVRSLYYLGADRRKDTATPPRRANTTGASSCYWKDGDIDRDKVPDAMKKVQ